MTTRRSHQTKEDRVAFYPPHGGALDAAARHFNIAKERWLDLSTGINPLPWPQPKPFPTISQDAWTRLPEEGAEADLLSAAALYYGAPAPKNVVSAPGSQSLIALLPRLFSNPLSVTVIEPTYGEHAPSWTAGGHNVRAIGDLSGLSNSDDVLVLCNPNNPDGRRWQADTILSLLGGAQKENPLIVVDEAYGDTDPRLSLASQVNRQNIIVLRSFGKFFGLGGARLGFALSAAPMAEKIRVALGPWAVSGPATAIATKALGDQGWIQATRTRLTTQRKKLDQILKSARLDVVGGTDLFCLVRHSGAAALFAHLCTNAILVRAFPAMPDRLRFGVPGNEVALHRLRDALISYRG